jgi:predicted RNA-binding Zn ribbon-like protein
MRKDRARSVLRRRTKKDFRFQDARLCFSFAGTLGDRGKPQPYERLREPADLGRWCVESGCLSAPPLCTFDDLVRAKQLREAVQQIGEALAAEAAPPGKDITIINSAAAKPPLIPKLSADGKVVRWQGDGLDAVLSAVARDLLVLCDSPLRERVRICGNDACGVPFVDTSHAGLRRWCSMKTCGALAKKRAYRARLRTKKA